jgi:hypothetical protein
VRREPVCIRRDPTLRWLMSARGARAGFDSVRQIAIDEDWSALRFRRVEYIKSYAGR